MNGYCVVGSLSDRSQEWGRDGDNDGAANGRDGDNDGAANGGDDDYSRSNRSACITLLQASTKSSTKSASASSLP